MNDENKTIEDAGVFKGVNVSEEFSQSARSFFFVGTWSISEAVYEWSDIFVLYNPADGKYFWEVQSGCSCDFPVLESLSDFTPGSLFDLRKFISSYKMNVDKQQRIIKEIENFDRVKGS